MAANGTSSFQVQRNVHRFTTVLTSAACEWFLIFLLLIDAVLSYGAKKFAVYCKLQIPCILCSRLDHLLGTEKPVSFQNLLCSNHRSEISSLISCHIHGKLANGCGMCEECMLSFATKIKSQSDKHKLLEGTALCSCCKKPLLLKQTRIAQLKSPRSGMTRPNIPLPRRLNHRESSKKMRDRLSGSATSHRLVNCTGNPLSREAYFEPNITSDPECEFPFSDDDEGSRSVHEMNESERNSIFQHASEVLPKAPGRNKDQQMLIRHSSAPSLQLESESLASDSHNIDDQGEHWKQTDEKTNHSPLPELILLDDIPSPILGAAPVGVPTEKFELKFPPSQNSNHSAISQLMSLADDPSLFSLVKDPGEASQTKSDETVAADSVNTFPNKHGEIMKLMTVKPEAIVKTGEAVDHSYPRGLTLRDPVDVWKPTDNTDTSDFIEEKIAIKKPQRDDIGLKFLLVDNASIPKVGVYLESPIPYMQCDGDKLQLGDASTSREVHMLQDSVLIERADSSGLDSRDGNFVGEHEGETIVEQLKQQLEYERRRINALYEELEQERSASAIAANQAMAMITRLQEEKAAIHMEALQYLRMMEEQAEYDEEALQKSNDLLAEREKEIQDLEADLEALSLQVLDGSMAGSIGGESFNLRVENMSGESASLYSRGYTGNAHHSPLCTEGLNGNQAEKPIIPESPWSDYEEEKLFISQSLKGLERKLRRFSHHGSSPYISDGDYSDEEMTDRGFTQGGTLDNGVGVQANGQMKERSLSKHVRRKSLPAHIISNSSIKDNESNHPASGGHKSSKQHEDIDLVSLENEIADLNERLEALESDWNLVEHTLNSLEAGKEGLQFVQQIAHQLQELRKMGVRSR